MDTYKINMYLEIGFCCKEFFAKYKKYMNLLGNIPLHIWIYTDEEDRDLNNLKYLPYRFK